MEGQPQIKSRIWHFPGAEKAFFTETEYSAHRFQPHFHGHYVFFSVLNGVNEGGFTRKRYTITSRDFLVIHPGEIHTGNSFSGRRLTYFSFCPTREFLIKKAEELGLPALPSFNGVVYSAKSIIPKFEALVKNSVVPGNDLAAEQSLTEFLGVLAEQTQDSRPVSKTENSCREKIETAKKFIEENYSRNFSLSELSLHTGLSAFHLLRSFKASVGLTPYAYLHNFRIEMAKKKIHKKISLTHLAHDSGFYDQSHFIRHFKKINGISPSAFKQ
ncbi:MAG: AraC family transcriptional regulator [Chitinophagaceae bacterium]|nr:AraC family transcriptional regulator [Chitinophagaceae bacterium]